MMIIFSDHLEVIMDIAIFGANGQTGRLLTGQALATGHRVVAATRRPDNFPLSDPKLTVAAADVRDPAAVTEVVAGVDAVLSTLGVSFTREPVNTYSVGTANIVAAMQSSGVRRLAVVSSTGAYPTRRSEFPLALRVFEPIITRTIGKTVYDDMREMEKIVRGSALDWTIVRPSGLFDLPAPTDYHAGEVDPIGGFTARIDLAHYLLTLADEPATVGKTVVVSTTEHTPTVWKMIRREARSKPADAPKPAAPASCPLRAHPSTPDAFARPLRFAQFNGGEQAAEAPPFPTKKRRRAAQVLQVHLPSSRRRAPH